MFRSPAYANVASTLALVVALGGSGVAIAAALPKDSVKSSTIKNNSIKGKDIKDNKVTGADINEGSLATVPRAGVAGTAYRASGGDEVTLDVAGPDGYETVLTLNVPAGDYLIIGKGSFNNNENADNRRYCRTTAGATVDDTWVSANTNGGFADVTPWTNVLVHRFAAPGSITLSCQVTAPAAGASNRSLVAMPIAGIAP